MEILKESLRDTIKKNYYSNKEFIWIGSIEHKRARKYKYEIFWLKTEDLWMQDKCIDFEDKHFDNCETRICETIKEAYAYGFNEIKDSLKEEPNSSINIIDLIIREDEN